MSGANNPANFRWTPEAIENLRKWRAEGLSSSQISTALAKEYRSPVSRSAVIGKLSRLGIAPPSRQASQVAAKINGARQTMPPRRFLSAQERTLPEAVATRRVVDLIRAEKREQAPKPPVAEVASPSPCCLLDLTPRSCRWPIATPAPDGQVQFCNKDHQGNGPYCAGHAKRAYTRTITNEQRAEEKRRLERHRAEARAAGLTDRLFGFGMMKRFA